MRVSYKSDCSLTTDTNIKPVTEACCTKVQLSRPLCFSLSWFYHKILSLILSDVRHNWNYNLSTKAWVYTMLSPMLCLTLAGLCLHVAQRCVERLQDVWSWCILLLFRLTKQMDTSLSSAPKRWESSGWVFISIQPPVKPEVFKNKVILFLPSSSTGKGGKEGCWSTGRGCVDWRDWRRASGEGSQHFFLMDFIMYLSFWLADSILRASL